jgi:hypothetical protein
VCSKNPTCENNRRHAPSIRWVFQKIQQTPPSFHFFSPIDLSITLQILTPKLQDEGPTKSHSRFLLETENSKTYLNQKNWKI